MFRFVTVRGAPLTVGNVSLCHGQGCALDQVGGINGRGSSLLFTYDQSQILLAVILANTAMDTVGLKTSHGADAALDNLHKIKLPSLYNLQREGLPLPYSTLGNIIH